MENNESSETEPLLPSDKSSDPAPHNNQNIIIKMLVLLIFGSIVISAAITTVIVVSKRSSSSSSLSMPKELSAPLPKKPKTVIKYTNSRIYPSNKKGAVFPTDCCASEDLRIIGGEDPTIYSHPWLAILKVGHRTSAFEDYICGGALITPRYVLTAAHCLYNFFSKDIYLKQVVLGIHNLSHGNDTNIQNLDVEEIIIHPNYYNDNQADIGLIRLARNANLSGTRVSTVCIMSQNVFMKKTEKYSVTGWGYTKSNDHTSLPVTPKRVWLPPINRKQCRKLWRGHLKIFKNVLCAGGQKGKDSCTLDSGSPLLRYINGSVFAAGIVMKGSENCGAEGYPGIYANVFFFLDWIKQIVRP